MSDVAAARVPPVPSAPTAPPAAAAERGFLVMGILLAMFLNIVLPRGVEAEPAPAH